MELPDTSGGVNLWFVTSNRDPAHYEGAAEPGGKATPAIGDNPGKADPVGVPFQKTRPTRSQAQQIAITSLNPTKQQPATIGKKARGFPVAPQATPPLADTA